MKTNPQPPTPPSPQSRKTTSSELLRPSFVDHDEIDEMIMEMRERMNDRDDPRDIDRYWSR